MFNPIFPFLVDTAYMFFANLHHLIQSGSTEKFFSSNFSTNLQAQAVLHLIWIYACFFSRLSGSLLL